MYSGIFVYIDLYGYGRKGGKVGTTSVGIPKGVTTFST